MSVNLEQSVSQSVTKVGTELLGELKILSLKFVLHWRRGWQISGMPANTVAAHRRRTPMAVFAIRNRASCLSIVQCADSEVRNGAGSKILCFHYHFKIQYSRVFNSQLQIALSYRWLSNKRYWVIKLHYQHIIVHCSPCKWEPSSLPGRACWAGGWK